MSTRYRTRSVVALVCLLTGQACGGTDREGPREESLAPSPPSSQNGPVRGGAAGAAAGPLARATPAGEQVQAVLVPAPSAAGQGAAATPLGTPMIAGGVVAVAPGGEGSPTGSTGASTAAASANTDALYVKDASGAVAPVEIEAPRGWQVLQLPTEPDPHAGKFTLSEAVAGLGGRGTLAARIETAVGSLYCDLFEDKAPVVVANFVGLARGKRKFWDAKAQAWVGRPFYAGTTFHRVIPGAYIHGGDIAGTGRGFIGYTIHEGQHPSLHQDRGGLLCMAKQSAALMDSQFFVTEAAVPDYEGRFPIFGQCQPVSLVSRIAHVPNAGPPTFRVYSPVAIRQVEIKRVAGGAGAWMPRDADRAPPAPGVVPQGTAIQVEDGVDDDR